MPAMIKSSLRQYYRQRRRSISPAEKIISSQALIEIFMSAVDFQQKNIAVYLAHDGEIDLQLLVEALWENQLPVFLPVVNVVTQQLQFASYYPSSIMKTNQYGIYEPDSSVLLAPENIDIVLMPVVAFDKVGARLGMGKGYYDKSFAFCDQSWFRPTLIGVAYSCQYCDELPCDTWDVRLDGMLTEKEFINFK